MNGLTALSCLINDFRHPFEPALERHLLEAGVKKRHRHSKSRFCQFRRFLSGLCMPPFAG